LLSDNPFVAGYWRLTMAAMLTVHQLMFRYIVFSIVATVLNLITQRIVLMGLEKSYGLLFAMLAGTLIGLVVKFNLDARWIFYVRLSGARTQSKQFGLYSFFGVITTGIFWGTETLFWVIWTTELAREIGAILGLTIGYAMKYKLDKRFVFSESPPWRTQ